MEAIQREQHAAYMRDLRQSREYKDRENKLRVLGRISEGSVPHVYSLTKYNITRDDINDLRRRNGFDDLIESIPYWAEATRLWRRNAGVHTGWTFCNRRAQSRQISSTRTAYFEEVADA
jgi:hypothetical protein